MFYYKELFKAQRYTFLNEKDKAKECYMKILDYFDENSYILSESEYSLYHHWMIDIKLELKKLNNDQLKVIDKVDDKINVPLDYIAAEVSTKNKENEIETSLHNTKSIDQYKNKLLSSSDKINKTIKTNNLNHSKPSFMTGTRKYNLDAAKKNNKRKYTSSSSLNNSNINHQNDTTKPFISPFNKKDNNINNSNAPSFVKKAFDNNNNENDNEIDPRLKGCDPKLVEMISNEIMDHSPQILWNDIAGLEFQKKVYKKL